MGVLKHDFPSTTIRIIDWIQQLFLYQRGAHLMLSIEAVRTAERPLGLIFWGCLIWMLDLTFSTTQNGYGFRFDLLDDTVGSLMVAVGINRLSRIPVSPAYTRTMIFLRTVMFFSVAETAIAHFIFPPAELYEWALLLLQLAQCVGLALFCLAMRWFCEAAGFPPLARHWTILTWIAFMVYLIPLLGVDLVAAIGGEPHHHYNLGVHGGAGALLILILAACTLILVYSLICLARTRLATKQGLVPTGMRGFPIVTAPDSSPPADVDTLKPSDFVFDLDKAEPTDFYYDLDPNDRLP